MGDDAETTDFSTALSLLRSSAYARARRACWKPGKVITLIESCGPHLPYIGLVYENDSRYPTETIGVWSPTHCDMLADDWIIL